MRIHELEQEFTKQKSTDASGMLSSLFTLKELATKSPKGMAKVASPQKSRDFYGKSIVLVIDEATRRIAAKISEKRHLEAAGSRLRLKLTEIKEETRKKERAKESLRKKLEQEAVAVQKKAGEISALEEVLADILAKKEEKTAGIEKRINEFAILKDTLHRDIKEKKEDLVTLAIDLRKQKLAIKSCMSKIEGEQINAAHALEAAKNRVKEVKSVEGDRMRIIMEKSRALKSLIMGEGASTSGVFSPKVSKILKSPSYAQTPTKHFYN